MKRPLSYLLTLGIAVILLPACKQDIANTQWDVDVIAPIIKTKLSMADLLADSLLTSSDNGALRLNLETSLIDLPLDSILKIPDTTLSKPISFPFPFSEVPPGTQIAPITDETPYNLGEVKLKRVILRSGKLKLSVASMLPTEVDFTYQIPLARLSGSPFEHTMTLPSGTNSSPSESEFEFDLSGYNIDLRGTNGSTFNTLSTTYIVSTSELGDTVSIAANDTFLMVDYSFVDIVPSYGKGYFGQQTTESENETTELDLLNRITDGQMFLDSVTIGLEITNPVGADARFKLDQLSSINTRTANSINLQHQIIGNNVLLTRAQDISGTAEDVIPSIVNYTVRNENSNIIEFIENLPNQLGFTFGFELNPIGNVSGSNDFFYYDRPFQALMNIDVPLRTTLNNLTLVDTIDWSLTESGVVESVNSGRFTVIANNGLPLSGEVELQLLDESMNYLGTLVGPSTISSPPLNAERKVESPLETRIEIPISEELADLLPQTKKVHVMVKFNTQGQPGMIEFYSDYDIDLKITGNFNINFGPSTP